MQKLNLSLNDAYDFVKRKKSNISPNFNFMGQLLDFERTLGLNSPCDNRSPGDQLYFTTPTNHNLFQLNTLESTWRRFCWGNLKPWIASLEHFKFINGKRFSSQLWKNWFLQADLPSCCLIEKVCTIYANPNGSEVLLHSPELFHGADGLTFWL